MRLKTSTFKPCHIICQLGSALDNVDGVKASLLEPTFRLIAKVRWEEGGMSVQCQSVTSHSAGFLKIGSCSLHKVKDHLDPWFLVLDSRTVYE